MDRGFVFCRLVFPGRRAMPRPVASLVRQAVVQRFQSGESAAMIAEALTLPVRTTREILAQFQRRGDPALKPDYTACGRQQSEENAQVSKAALALRQQHPKWGAGRILIELRPQFPGDTLPSERTLQRWLRDQSAPPAPAGRPSKSEYVRALVPHEVWQVDAGEQKRLASGKMISWLRFVDECSGGVLKTFVFSRRPLQPRSPGGGADVFWPGFSGVGPARWRSGGQWGPLGFGRRFAHGILSVAFRLARQDDLEPAPPTAIQRRRGTLQPLGERVGRTGDLSNRRGVQAPRRPRGPSATRTVSRPGGPVAARRLSRAFDPAQDLQPHVGEDALEFRIGQGGLVALCSSKVRGQFGKNWRLWRQVICGPKTPTQSRLAAFRPESSGVGCQRYPRPTNLSGPGERHQPVVNLKVRSRTLNPFPTHGKTLCRDFGKTLCRYFAAKLYVG